MGDIFFVGEGINLVEVEVVGEVVVIENCIDKMVYNVEKDIINIGGDVLEVLVWVFMLVVDLDGWVLLRGFMNI